MKIDAETLKKQVILHLPYILFLLVFAKLGEAVRLAPGADASQKLLGLSEGFALAFQSMWPGAAMDWLIGLCGAAIMRLAVYLRGKDAKKYRKNVEYGSARWVINNCGVGWNFGRLTADGLLGVCTPVSSADAKPGDLIFFQGTYNTSGASHVGIYVGNGMMIHCGDPISYANINTSYWQQHFYTFGRLP